METQQTCQQPTSPELIECDVLNDCMNDGSGYCTPKGAIIKCSKMKLEDFDNPDDKVSGKRYGCVLQLISGDIMFCDAIIQRKNGRVYIMVSWRHNEYHFSRKIELNEIIEYYRVDKREY